MSTGTETSPIVLKTAKCSLAAQVVFTLITAASIALPRDAEHDALVPISILETVSQVIEFTYYVVVLFWYGKILTWTRYLDWFFSTPIMLVSTMGFLLYLQDPSNRLDDIFSSDYVFYTIATLAFNWLMLLFGLLVELDATKYPNVFLGLGTLSFMISFASLLLGFVGDKPLGFGLVLFMYIVWGMYGIAATQSNDAKNVAYNLLDIVSKNFYGVFLFVYGLTLLN